MTKCLVLGGNGFIGSHLARRLFKEGYEVYVFDNFKRGVNDLISTNDEIKLIKGHFFNQGEVNSALDGIDYVFHYISTTTPTTAIKDPIYDMESNVISSIKLFQSCIKKNIKKVVFPSSGGTIYGEPLNIPVKESDPTNPINPYAIGKLTIEKYLYYLRCIYGLDYTILRYSNPYGEGQNPYGDQGVISIFLNKIKRRENPIIYGDGAMVRDYIYIEDLVEATLAALEKNMNPAVFNVGSGIGVSLNDLIKIMSDVTGQEISPIYVKNPPAYISKIILDISRIKKEACWKPTVDLQEGISKTWKWISKL